jgi:hypothetical protein
MNFKQATNALLESVTLEDLANALKVPVQSIRQARAAEGTAAHRSPPAGWEAAAARLAAASARRLEGLAGRLREATGPKK